MEDNMNNRYVLFLILKITHTFCDDTFYISYSLNWRPPETKSYWDCFQSPIIAPSPQKSHVNST